METACLFREAHVSILGGRQCVLLGLSLDVSRWRSFKHTHVKPGVMLVFICFWDCDK